MILPPAFTLLLPAALFVMTPAAVQLMADLALAMKRAGIKQASAATDMAIRESKLNEALNAKGVLNVARLTALSPEFWRELVKIIAPRFGLHVIDDARLAETVTRAEALIARLDAPPARKRMARAS